MKRQDDDEWENANDPQNDFDELGNYMGEEVETTEDTTTSNDDWDE